MAIEAEFCGKHRHCGEIVVAMTGLSRLHTSHLTLTHLIGHDTGHG